MKTFTNRLIYLFILVFLLVVKGYAQQNTIYFSGEVVVSTQQELFVNQNQLVSSPLENTFIASKIPVVKEHSRWSTQVFKITAKEDFKVEIDDLFLIEFVTPKESREKKSWYLAFPKTGIHWLTAASHWRSATQTFITKYPLSKKTKAKFFNLHITSYYVFSNKNLYNQQVAYQPTSSYDDRLLNPMLTSFPPPLAS